MIDAVFFDMDGTLLDTEILWTESNRSYLEKHGVVLTAQEILDLTYGIAWREIYQELIRKYPHLTDSMEEMSRQIQEVYNRLRGQQDIRIHNSIALLRELAEDYPIAIVSGSESHMVEAGIEMMGIGDCVDFYLSGDRYSPSKPDPTCYLMAAQRLEVDPQRCLVFEDSQAGVNAAKRAGMYCVALARDGRPAQDVSNADHILGDLGDFCMEEFASLLFSRSDSMSTM